MRRIKILELYDSEYNISAINALRQYWKDNKIFSCLGKPKKHNMVLYLNGCKAEYTMKNGAKIRADSGSFVYTAKGSEYHLRFYDIKDENSYTIGVNFLLFDSQGESIVFDNNIQTFCLDNADYRALFHKLEKYSMANIICIGKLKSIMYDFLFKLSEYYKKELCDNYRIIAKGITYLEQGEEQQLTIREIADMCHVSETYFRKMFKKYSGMSPMEYRINSKICKAKMYLKTQDLNVTEIAEKIGFEDVSYFILKFRQVTGMTPKEYRNK